MSSATVRIQAGTRLVYDGDAAQVVELVAVESGVNVVLRVSPDHLVRVPLRELLTSDHVCVVPTGPGPSGDGPWDTASVVLAELAERERTVMRERAAHIREVLTAGGVFFTTITALIQLMFTDRQRSRAFAILGAPCKK
jgi:hypothetical protein